MVVTSTSKVSCRLVTMISSKGPRSLIGIIVGVALAGWCYPIWRNRAKKRSNRASSRAVSRNTSFQQLQTDSLGPPTGSRPASAPSTPRRTSDGATDAADRVSREQLVWELLHEPKLKLVSPEVEASWARAISSNSASVQESQTLEDLEGLPVQEFLAKFKEVVTSTAERAFWDLIEEKVASSPNPLAELSRMLSELGSEVSELIMDKQKSAELLSRFSESALLREAGGAEGQMASSSKAALALVDRLQELADPLLMMAPEDNKEEAQEAYQRMKVSMERELQQGEDALAPRFAPVLTRSLRLLSALAKLTKADLASMKLRALREVLKEQGAVEYLRLKMEGVWGRMPSGDPAGTVEGLRQQMPMTWSWVSQARDSLGSRRQALVSTGLPEEDLAQDGGAVATMAISGDRLPTALRTGVLPLQRTSTSRKLSPSSLAPNYPVSLDSWQGILRCGLVDLISGDQPAATGQLPEVLQYDKERLHRAQNTFQQVLVMTTGFLIIQQFRQRDGMSWSLEDRTEARRRLLVVLADPMMSLADLVTEMTRLAGSKTLETEQQLQTTFSSAVAPQSAVFRSVQTALEQALSLGVLRGPKWALEDGRRVLSNILTRVGGTAVLEDVVELAQSVARISAVVEAVHGPWLSLM